MISRRRTLSRELRMYVGTRLRELRMQHNESQEAVAWAADVTQGSISNYENGRNEIPLSVLISICEYFNTPLSEVFPEVVSGQPRSALGAFTRQGYASIPHEAAS